MEFALVFEGASGKRLGAAEQLITSLPSLLSEDLQSLDLGYAAQGATLLVKVCVRDKAFGPAISSRLDFWASASGGSLSGELSQDAGARRYFAQRIALVNARELGVAPGKLNEALAALFKAAGLDSRRQAPRAECELPIELGGSDYVVRDVSQHGFFVMGNHAPPMGDTLRLKLTLPGSKKAWEVEAKVAHVRSVSKDTEHPAGFGLALKNPPEELTQALGNFVREQHLKALKPQLGRRASPRYPMHAPVDVAPLAAAPAKQPAAAAPAPVVRLSYDSAQALSRDYVENLSLGGALVRTPAPLPVQSRVSLEIGLPTGVRLIAPGTVVHSTADTMGIEFQLDPAGKRTLAEIIERLAITPRRALIASDNEPWEREFIATLKKHHVSSICVRDGTAALHQLMEELLSLDVLVLSHRLTGLPTEHLLQLVRGAGGERELAIVVLAPRTDPNLEKQLRAQGADAVLASDLSGAALARALLPWFQR